MATTNRVRNAMLAAEIRAEMGRQRVTGRTLASMVHMPVTTTHRYINGDTEMGLDAIERFAEALNVSTVDLVTRAFSTAPPPFSPVGAGGGNDTAETHPTNPCLSGSTVIMGPWEVPVGAPRITRHFAHSAA